MVLWVILPVKPFNLGKSRLSGVLTTEERVELNSKMLAHTLEVLKDVPTIEQVLVVSRDQKVLSLARHHGARTLQENEAPHLNVALTRATVVVQSHAASGVLILPSDLPRLTSEDVCVLIERAKESPVVVLASDRHQQGTNALLVCPPGLIEYDYGPGSFIRHCERARQAGARLEIVELESLQLDIDLPEDLELLEPLGDLAYPLLTAKDNA
jgi:2-phospho-L-lactate guanylyltransferase